MNLTLKRELVKQLPNVARAAGIAEDRELAGLLRLHLHCIEADTALVTPLDIATAWGLGELETARFMEVHLAAGVLVSDASGFLVPSCEQYPRRRGWSRAGGKKAQGNLKQFAAREVAPASTSSSESGPGAPSTPAPGARALSAQEQCWDYLDHLAREHCAQLGQPRESQPRPKLCNPKLNNACEAAGVVDFILDSRAYTRWDHLGVLFRLYLNNELGRVDREGKLRSPLWPIELFLSEGVLRRLKEQEERAA